MILDRILNMTGRHWLVLFGAVILAWCALYAMAVSSEMRDAGRLYGADFWSSLCTVTPDAAGLVKVWAMWVLMSGAMMAPTVIPALATYDDLPHADHKNFGLLVGGYLAIWVGFSVLAAGLQMLLFRLDLVSAFGDSRSRVLSAGLLVVAGLYQFSALKESCLAKCRMPLTFFMQHWDEGPWRNGLRLGMICLGCCWALMLLGFVGGVMNLAFMGLATVIMVVEKLPDLGKYITKPLGAGLILSGFWIALTPIF